MAPMMGLTQIHSPQTAGGRLQTYYPVYQRSTTLYNTFSPPTGLSSGLQLVQNVRHHSSDTSDCGFEMLNVQWFHLQASIQLTVINAAPIFNVYCITLLAELGAK